MIGLLKPRGFALIYVVDAPQVITDELSIYIIVVPSGFGLEGILSFVRITP